MRIVGLAPWPYIPAQSGGTERTLNLFAALGEMTSFAIDWQGDDDRQQVGDIDYRVFGAPLAARDKARRLQISGVATYDPMPMLVKNDLAKLQAQIDALEPDIVVMEHPWLIDFVPKTAKLVLDAANCETVNTQQQYPRTFDVDLVKNLERRAVERADLITYASHADTQALRRLFKVTAPMVHIPNGTDVPKTISNGSTRNLVFIGSVYQPNVVAAQLLVNQAGSLPDYQIHIIGGCSEYLQNTAGNVTLHGQVTDEERDQLFADGHAFVTMTTHGSGTHLKISRALAHGLPVVTTELGARGYSSDGVITTTLGDLPKTMADVTEHWAEHSQAARGQAAHLLWPAIQKTFRDVVEGLR
jgi:glycosyltransferase involved in cell wall biosynthesis